MGNSPFWLVSPDDPRSTRRVERMTSALVWLREVEGSFAVFGDVANSDRYVQFANSADGSASNEAQVAVAMLLPELVTAAAVTGEPTQHPGPMVHEVVGQPPQWIEGYFGEPDHEPLLMEVGSALWPGSSSRGLAHDDTVVAKLSALGLHLGGGSHTCLNFCRDGVTEPSEILAALSEEIMVQIVGAGPGYRLAIKRGQFAARAE